MPKVFSKPADLLNEVGTTLGPTDWITIDQERINQFADATGDHQWIHVDPERAREGPFGATIAHGYLTLSLASLFLPQMIEVQGVKMGINVGLDKVRFTNPVRVNSRIRGRGEIIDVSEIKGAIQSVVRITVEIDGEERPACIADTISRYYPE
ncbi:MAG: MaoC family dehydratase [Candidatus Dadabacteria bacterium]|nr:MAG: MaoC family dehydratase [Candidatus Dadabacteria bacterium]